jgi:DNA (cytosine-5)-methyltransferase 1
MSISTIDLFAGAGGLTLGPKKAGFRTVCAVEIEPNHVETFAGHSRGMDIHIDTICRVDVSSYLGNIDLVSGEHPGTRYRRQHYLFARKVRHTEDGQT